jgi:hypothetical protein
MSSRVSQPLRPTSTRRDPNWSRSYPVVGARPFTFNAATACNAVVWPAKAPGPAAHEATSTTITTPLTFTT